ncbi:MAG: glycosyltransferase [Pyrinomonadaceae bacterium]|nr:glycosyltransferase [Phycisphaerales bacterium]
MDISFIIPAHDEAVLIGGTIRAIHESVRRQGMVCEVVVAADGCTDATESIAAALGAKVVAHERRSIAATRNLGARAASGDLLVFVDADTQMTPGAFSEMLAAIESGAIGGGGPARFDGRVPLYARAMLALLLIGFRCMRLTGGAFLFCTREAFDAAGGWDETFYAGEEILMARRLKKQGRFVIVREPVVTSGRKFRTHSSREILGVLVRGAFMPWIMKDRSRLEFFYGPRRVDGGEGKEMGNGE